MAWEWVAPTATGVVSLGAIGTTLYTTRRQFNQQLKSLDRQHRHELDKELLQARRVAYGRYLLARDTMVMLSTSSDSWNHPTQRPAVFGEFHTALYGVILLADEVVTSVLPQDSNIVFELRERGIPLGVAKELGVVVGAAMVSELSGEQTESEKVTEAYNSVLARMVQPSDDVPGVQS